MRRLMPVVILAFVLAATAAWAQKAALTATKVRIGEHPGFTRVVVEFAGTGPLQLGEVELDSTSSVFETGVARFAITPPGVKSTTSGKTARNLRATLARRSKGGLSLRLTGAKRRYKAVSEEIHHNPERLVLDLWLAAPPTAASTIRNDGCLALDSFTVSKGRIRAAGRALRQLFEAALVLEVRDATGKSVGTKPATAANNRWRQNVSYSVTKAGRGTLEATVYSAKDGSLECLVQVPVTLTPR